MPLTFADKHDYNHIAQGDMLELETINLQKNLNIKNTTTGTTIPVECDLSDLDKAMIQAGGKLAAIRQKQTS